MGLSPFSNGLRLHASDWYTTGMKPTGERSSLSETATGSQLQTPVFPITDSQVDSAVKDL